jgi:peroxiredoxin Q/BCP
MHPPGTILDLDFDVFVPRNGKKTRVRFGELIERSTLVTVYMKNETSVCDVQIGDLAMHAPRFETRGIDLIALSKDTCASQMRYADKRGIGFTMVSDPTKEFATATDSLVERSMYGKKYFAPARNAYLIDPSGELVDYVEVDAPRHAAQLLELLDRCGR